MNCIRRECLGLSVVFAITTLTVAAQGLTGTLVGAVQDEHGGVLVGAVIRAASPAVFGGELQTTTNERGEFRFPVLAPGRYALSVEMPTTFAPYREEGIELGAGAALDRTVVLKLTGLTESITVEGASQLDAQRTGLETRFRHQDIDVIPTRRFSMFDLIRSAPGVSPTSPSSGTVNTVSVFGSAVNENAFLIDGTNFTCPCQGVSRAEPSVDVIQEVTVQTAGASVEFGNMQGGVVNVITKQGGDRYHYDASYYGQPSGLTAKPVTLAAANGVSTGYKRVEYRDATTNLGGPIRRDRLWFFGGYQYLRDYDSQPGADPAFPRKYEQNKVFGKLTWKLTPSVQLMQSFHEERWKNPAVPTVTTPFVATQLVHGSVPSMTFGNLTQVLSSSTVWDVRVGRFAVDQKSDPSTGDRTTPSHRDQVSGLISANAPQMDAISIDRITAKAVLRRHQSAWLWTDHDFTVGTQIERGQHHSVHAFPGGVQYVDSSGAPSQAIYRSPWIGGGRNNTAAAFASDSLAVTHRVTVDAGVRFDHSRAQSPDLGAVDALGRETAGLTKGLGTLYTWNVLSPRVGAVVKLSSDARTMMRINYGRFDQGVLTGELEPFHPGATPITTMGYDATTGGYTRLISVVDSSNLALDPHTRAPRTDEYSIALDREIASQWLSSIAYVRKRGTNFIAWTDTTGQYQEQTRTIGDGITVPVFVLTSPTAGRRFLLTNPSGLFLDYDGLVVAMEKRMSHRWQASTSYTFSRAYGLQTTSNAAVSEPQFSTIARPTFLTFGQDPNDLTNARGRLPNDRPHAFRAASAVQLPWQGLMLAGDLQYFTGRPWAATAQVALPQSGRQRIVIEPRGSRRLSAQTPLDARISKTVTLRGGTSVDVRLDLLNALNDHAEETLQSDVLFDAANVRNPTFGKPTTFMDPRRVMLSVRLNFGR